ncbi:MAG: M23 family metallopeptidase [Bauldia sp.]|nr:M23 family metallopeptidase [Bauldia sp.]
MRGATRRPSALGAAAATYFDLGTEPALAVSTGARPIGAPARRAVSMRWLSGTVLTGFTSFLLMGGALVVALNGQDLLATAPQTADLGFVGSRQPSGQKGDRIIPEPPPATSREVLQLSTITRADGREIIQQRPFVHIQATLATADITAIDIPAYDPLAIIGQTAAGGDATTAEPGVAGDRLYGPGTDGEFVLQPSPFPLGAAFADVGPVVTAAEVEALVRQAAPSLSVGEVRVAALAHAGLADEFGGDGMMIEPPAGVRSIPENATFVSKSDGGRSRDERLVTVEVGQTLGALLVTSGVSEADSAAVVAAMDQLMDLAELGPEERVRIAFSPAVELGDIQRPLRISIYTAGTHQATVALNDLGVFVRADEPPALPAGIIDDAPQVVSGRLPTLYEAMYATAREQQVPDALINQLIRTFAFVLDMTSRVGPRDSIEIFHAMPDPDDPAAPNEGILLASVTVAGVTKAYYRFQNPDNGLVDYYDADGRSAYIFLMRKPMAVGELRSAYGMRRHPILGTYTMHAGVDYAAPRGTPIMASGDGTVVSAGWSSSYGNYTRIEHANGYETAYAHQTSIIVEPGEQVRQGQIIGYVGSTGLSTGPHLHFEIRINGSTVDPLRIRLPEGTTLSGANLTDFDAQVREINTLLGITPGRGGGTP